MHVDFVSRVVQRLADVQMDLSARHDVDPIGADEELACHVADASNREDRCTVRDGELPVGFAREDLFATLTDEGKERPAIGVIDHESSVALARELTLKILDECRGRAGLPDEDNLIVSDAANKRAGRLREPVERRLLAEAANLRCAFDFK